MLQGDVYISSLENSGYQQHSAGDGLRAGADGRDGARSCHCLPVRGDSCVGQRGDSWVLGCAPDGTASPAVSLSESPCSKCTRDGRAARLGVQGHMCEQTRGCWREPCLQQNTILHTPVFRVPGPARAIFIPLEMK